MGDGLILYQSEILKYGRKPNNFGVIRNATIATNGDSPICGDHMTLYLKINESKITDIKFSSEACCAVCRASSSMMTDILKGKTTEKAKKIKALFLDMIEKKANPETYKDTLGELLVFERIHKVPSRIECAVLSWTTLDTALTELEETA